MFQVYSSDWGDIMMQEGDIMSAMVDNQCIERINSNKLKTPNALSDIPHMHHDSPQKCTE